MDNVLNLTLFLTAIIMNDMTLLFKPVSVSLELNSSMEDAHRFPLVPSTPTSVEPVVSAKLVSTLKMDHVKMSQSSFRFLIAPTMLSSMVFHALAILDSIKVLLMLVLLALRVQVGMDSNVLLELPVLLDISLMKSLNNANLLLLHVVPMQSGME